MPQRSGRYLSGRSCVGSEVCDSNRGMVERGPEPRLAVACQSKLDLAVGKARLHLLAACIVQNPERASVTAVLMIAGRGALHASDQLLVQHYDKAD